MSTPLVEGNEGSLYHTVDGYLQYTYIIYKVKAAVHLIYHLHDMDGLCSSIMCSMIMTRVQFAVRFEQVFRKSIPPVHRCMYNGKKRLVATGIHDAISTSLMELCSKCLQFAY